MKRRSVQWRAAAGGLLCAALAAGLWGAGCAERGPAWPGRRWGWKSPGRAGFSAEKLQAFSDQAGGTGCLVHGGRMIHEWGDTAFRNDVASSTKPIYAFLTFKAIEEGRIGSLDDRVAGWVPELEGLNAERGFKDRKITFRHLLSQTSGYGLEEDAGEAFAYNDYATGLLAWTLFHRVYASPPGQDDEVLNGELLGKALGFEHAPTVRHRNSRPHRIRISARDLARFALLYLRGGEWQGRRVLREDLFREALSEPLPMDFPRTSGEEVAHLEEVQSIGGGKDQKNHLGCLGYFWWFNRITPDGMRLLPDAPAGTFMGSGYGGRFAMVVMPELDLIAVWLDVYKETGKTSWCPLSEVGRFKVNKMIRELLAARVVSPP
ncbi:MAG: class C beta-lactamase-related serine hydrolase [Opitutae bacterium]|nr:class C beta-lactamase-related serine hydrolase [Opitutae bacterium]